MVTERCRLLLLGKVEVGLPPEEYFCLQTHLHFEIFLGGGNVPCTKNLKNSLTIHRLRQIPNAEEINTILFNELMNMITGDLAMTRYISQNVKRSGLEIWKLNRNNDPNT